MLFNSLEFLIFLPSVFIFYWFVFNNNLQHQNLLVVFASYVFYGWWDWRFLSLIFLSTIVDYRVGRKIHSSKTDNKRKIYLFISILFNLGLLGFFKYFNFFIESWINLVRVIGVSHQSTWTLKVILPVGISFYTFQTISYSLDIYFGRLKPTKDFISFASFVSFFPQLIAGPIERASNLLPQILNKRTFNYQQGVQGLRLILWGMFKKVVIADSLAPFVDNIFQNYGTFNGGVLLLGLIYFSFQIYCDFSGYSDMAIGISKLFGFELLSNFNFPYFSRNIGEFWRRWHISLSSWFRDYLYIPLGGSRFGKMTSFRNIFLIFIISGLWHGANWTFVIWGLFHALLYIPYFLQDRNSHNYLTVVAEDSWFPSLEDFFKILLTYFSVILSWAFFRSETIFKGFEYIIRMATNISLPDQNRAGVIYVVIILVLDWLSRRNERNVLTTNNTLQNWIIMLVFSILIIFFSFYNLNSKFIYYQF